MSETWRVITLTHTFYRNTSGTHHLHTGKPLLGVFEEDFGLKWLYFPLLLFTAVFSHFL